MCDGRNIEKDLKVVSFELLFDELEVVVTYEGGLTQKLGVFHLNKECKTILCDDFSTFLSY